MELGGWPQLHTVGGLRASCVMHENSLACSLGTSLGVVWSYRTVNTKVFQ